MKHPLDLEDLDEAAALVDPLGKVTHSNRAWREQFSQGNLLRQLGTRPSRRPFRELLGAFLRGEEGRCALEFAWNLGLWVRASARRLQGSPECVLVRMENVSERIRIGHTSYRFESLVDQLPEPVFFLDSQTGQTIYANDAVLRLMETGTKEELTTTNYGPLFAPQLLENLVERLASAGSMTVESTHRTAFGRRFPVALTMLLLREERGALIAGVSRDISVRTRHLSELQSATGRLQAIMEAAPVAIVTYTLEGLVASWNSAAERIYGWTAQEVLLKPSPFPENPFADHLNQILEHRSTRTVQTRRTCKGGRAVELSLSICPLINDRAQVAGLLEVAEDITDRVHDDLVRINRRLLEVREAERMSLAREIHDGPLQDLIAVGFSLADTQSTLATHEGSNLLKGQRTAVLEVARQLRSVVSRLRPAGLEEFGLVAALEGMVARMGRDFSQVPETQLTLQDLPELSPAQQLCIFRVVQEAYLNCLKHAKATKVAIIVRQLPSHVELTVTDDGCGFAAPLRLDDMTPHDHFGLIGMEERSLLANGTFRVISNPGKGTQVCVTVPILSSP